MIFDVGCHIGEDSEFYLKKGFHVVAVEANPVLCAGLKQRFASEIASGHFTLIEKAIAEQDGEVEFFVNPNASIWGTIRPDAAERHALAHTGLGKIVVPSIMFPSLIEQFGTPYYMKVDIEGADLLCLEGLLPFKDRPRFVSVEIDHQSLLHTEMRLFRRMGYSRFQIIDQTRVPAQRSPLPAKEGTYTDYTLGLGMSGLFGEELPDTWLTVKGAVAKQLQLIVKNRLLGLSKVTPALKRIISTHSGSWYDLHAARAA